MMGVWPEKAVKFLNFRMPKNFAVIYLKFKQRGQALGYFVKMMQMQKQTVKTLIRLLLEEQSDLSLHCLPISICPKTQGQHGKKCLKVVHNAVFNIH